MKHVDYEQQENISSQEKGVVSCFDQGISERASEPLKVNQNILNQVFKSPV